MKKSEVKIGSVYTAMISGNLVKVRIVSEGERGRGCVNGRTTTCWTAVNLKTGREVTIKSAMKLRREVQEGEPVGPKGPKANTTQFGSPQTGFPEDGGTVGGPSFLPALPAFLTSSPPNPSEHAPVGPTTPPVAPPATNGKWKLSEKLQAKVDSRSSLDTAPHVIVEARAGTGKTTTLIEGLKRVKGLHSSLTPSVQQKAVWEAMEQSKGKVQSIAFVAFNKSIAKELQEKVPAGCDAMTMHSMGFKAVMRAFSNVKVESYRVQDIISEILEKDIRELRKTKPVLLKATEDLVGLCKQNLVGNAQVAKEYGYNAALVTITEEELDRLASHYEVELNGSRSEVFALVPKVLERCKDVSRDRCIDFNDMIWLPVVLDLPCYKYDLLLWDEAQDGNKCQQQLALRCGRRLVLCGDRHQAIYGFAGADADSIPNMERILGATERGCVTLPLTVTRRCGKEIVREAQAIVKDFDAFETNGEGKVSRAPFATVDDGVSEPKANLDYRSLVQDGDFILCRVNAPLVSQCFRFLKAGRKAVIQGRDIGQGLISTIKKLHATDVVDLMSKISDWCNSEVNKENAKRNPSEQKLIGLQDRKECLEAFMENATTVEQVIEKINAVFTDNSTGGIRLSSIHRCKGLEAKRVFLIEPKGATVPHPMAKSAWQKTQEWNLRYVAITRAIEELVYVS